MAAALEKPQVTGETTREERVARACEERQPLTREERVARAREAMRLYAVTDRAWTDDAAGRTLEAQVAAALAGGATCVQLREKHLDDAAFLEEAFRIRDLCRAAGVPFFVNDNVGIALAVGADGVHVGQDDMPVAEVRRLVGPNMLVGVSAHTVDEAMAAVAGGADCLGVGTMFPTATKDDAEAVSFEELTAICAAVDVGVVAIGGIKAENIPQFTGTGIDGVAVVSAIFAAPDVEAATRNLRREIDAIVGQPCRFAAAVFDFDGTLFDSMPLWFTCGDRFLESVGRTPKPNLWDTFRTMSLEEGALWVQAEYDLDLTQQEIIDGINGCVERGYFEEVLPKPGMVSFVQALRASGVRCVIATATDAYLIEAALARLGIRDLFEGIYTCGGLHTTKHEPLIFREAAASIGGTRETTVIFEDAIHAIRTAKADGFSVVGIADSFQDDPAEIREAVDTFLDTFEAPEAFWAFAKGADA